MEKVYVWTLGDAKAHCKLCEAVAGLELNERDIGRLHPPLHRDCRCVLVTANADADVKADD